MATPRATTILNEVKTALQSISTANGYNYNYGVIQRGSIDHSGSPGYPTIEVRQLKKDEQILANQTYIVILNLYIIVSHDVGAGLTQEEKEDIVEKLKQDVLLRLNEAYIENEFTYIELMGITNDEHSIESEPLLQGGIALQVQYRLLYTEF